ncbi:MAG: AAA family ATPase [Prevotellaceae bacterium]|jgi:ATP-dependent exoDNAse (exonuclease V) alpha subunit|nr:AAA family ATPase [Prevotellaceae bacterium]
MSNNSKYFKLTLTTQQEHAFNALRLFAENLTEKIFVLRGYAGTGKTTLMSGFIKYLSDKNKNYKLLATTGRAAKILGDKTNTDTRTVHSLIYNFNELSEDMEKIIRSMENKTIDKTGQLRLIFDMEPIVTDRTWFYIVDEASMMSDKAEVSTSFAKFGSGDLLGDLFKYDPKGKFIFVGDPCQLPPVSQVNSPALEPPYLIDKYKFNVRQVELTEIMRQDPKNGIVSASLKLRNLYKNPPAPNPNWKKAWSFLPVKGFKNITIHSSHIDMVNEYLQNVQNHDFEYATLICQTNKLCSNINSYLRKVIHNNPTGLVIGDLLMVTQNNYIVDLVNGDQVTVEKIGTSEWRANMTFRKIEVKELASKKSYSLLLIEDVLNAVQPNINEEQHKSLMIDYFQRMKAKGIDQKHRLFKINMLSDPYLNALRASYGYALTCHKSQGGEWNEVYLYMDKSIQALNPPGIYQWWYTAVTRAKEHLHVVDDWFVK